MKENVIRRKIMWGDLDSLGIVFYPRYYEWMDGCGHLFLESLGLKLGDLWKERNILFGLAETSCRYLRPGRYLQEIEISTQIDRLNKKTLILKHVFRRATDKVRLVEGMEKRICMDVSDQENLRATDIPEDIYAVLRNAVDE
jgi:YbgC/YbaW family acyl-CoA thioester hydrolase